MSPEPENAFENKNLRMSALNGFMIILFNANVNVNVEN